MVASGARGLRACQGFALAVVCLAAAVAACGEEAPRAEEPPRPQELVIFVYDRSTSIPDHTLELAQRLTRERIVQLDHGDRIAGMQLLQLSLEEPPRRWSEPIPERTVRDFEVSRDSIARARFIADADVLLQQLSAPKDRNDVDGTDILSTLHDVAAEMQAYPDYRATLYLFSDMLQSNRQIDMEGLRLMPPADWVVRSKSAGTLPDLTGLCVVVVGARVDTREAQRVKAFWKEYFDATGAKLEDRNYTLRPIQLPTSPCS